MWMRKTSTLINMKSTQNENFTRIRIVSHLILVSCILTCVTTDYIPQAGLMSPLISPSSVIDAVFGEVIYLKITQPVEGQTSCMYRTSGGKDVDVHRPHNPNIEAWTKETCGLRINNVTMQESGFWRLSSISNNNVAKGITLINVQRAIAKPPEKKEIDLIDGDMTPIQLDNPTSYCYVLRPDQTESTLPSHENCYLPKLDSIAQRTGIWNIVSGVKGKTHEFTFQVNVRTKVEELQTFVERNLNSLNMKCKLVNSNKLVKFCRFLRSNDDVGFNLEEGRGETRYRYFGNGFQNRECGISIANAEENDKSPWKCFVGVDDEGELKTIGTIIDASDPQQPYTQGDIESSNVYGLQDTNVSILCKRNVPTDYCWFRDPSGRRISVSDRKALQPNDSYGYYGTGIKLGECGLTIVKATLNQSGTWSCHMGATHSTFTDAFQEISVRITETSLVSTNLIHDAQHGTSLVLECRTIPEYVPLEYCRFVLPDGTGFSMNEKTTVDKPHMDNYYFNPNRQLKSGYCSMIVKKIDRNIHQGQWLCAAHLSGDDHESFDEFRVNVFEADNSIAVAGITGMTFASVLVIGGIVFIAFKKYRQKIAVRSRRTTRQTVVTYIANTECVSISSSQLEELQSTTDENIQLHSIESRC